MFMSHPFTRGLAVAALALAATFTVRADPIPEEYKQGGFAIGLQAYTFNRFTVFEAIEKLPRRAARSSSFSRARS